MTATIVTTVYANANVYRAGAKSLQRTIPNYRDVRHLQLDNKYPIGWAELHNEMLMHGVKFPRVKVLDAGKNLGLHGGVNYMLKLILEGYNGEPPADDNDIVIAIDADDDPVHIGWVDTFVDVFAALPKLGWASLMCEPGRDVLNYRNVPIQTVDVGRDNHIRYRKPGFPLINTVCAWRVKALRELGDITEPHAYYGGIEVDMMPKFEKAGWDVIWLEDFTVLSHRHLHDQSYEIYKRRHVGHEAPIFPGSFDDFIAAGAK